MSATLTARDLDILESLTRRVRLLSLDQVEAIWWPAHNSHRVIRRRLHKLKLSGLLETTTINAHPPLKPTRPLWNWAPGRDEPDFRAIAARSRARWALPAVPTEVHWATSRAASLYASTAGALPSVPHRDHDLLLGDVFVFYRTQRPAEASQWRGEDALPKAGYKRKDPDAFLFDDLGRVQRVVESAGRYGSAQVRSFHDYCAQLHVPYELW